MSSLRYTAPPPGPPPAKHLVAESGSPGEQRFVFYESIEIGRDQPGRPAVPGQLLVDDPTISFRHAIVHHSPGGCCTVRDLSRNGTRLDGRRLVPNVETEFRAGQVIEIPGGIRLALAGVESQRLDPVLGGTLGVPGLTFATVLVGDIRDYTVLVRRAPSAELQQSVGRVFERLTNEVVQYGGTVKEYQGDAIFAFWEGPLDGRQAIKACTAASALDRLACRLAEDRTAWQLADFPLRMDWALATGPVVIDSVGSTGQRAGLSMIGESVVLAFRLEKFVTSETGPIIACHMTHSLAKSFFAFRDLGEMQAKGFDRPDHAFALLGPLPGDTTGSLDGGAR
jgi:class 3 adenylate cyclase